MKSYGLTGARRPWLAFGLAAAAIFFLTPFARSIQTQLKAAVGSTAIFYGLFAAIILIACRLLLSSGRISGAAANKSSRLKIGEQAAVIAPAAVFLWYSYTLRANPEEAFHFIEYGGLSYLGLRALSSPLRAGLVPGLAPRLSAAMLTVCVGTCEELYQWILPNRFFDLRDIGLNGFAAVTVQAGLYLFDLAGGRKTEKLRQTEEVRVLCSIGIFFSALLLLITVLTPGRVGRIIETFPSLSYLQDEPVFACGNLIKIDDAAVFRSVLTEEGLVRCDSDRGAAVSAKLQSEDPGRRDEFLAEYSEVRDPCVHEAEVHIFRRNFYAAAWKAQRDDAEAARIAVGEQLILDKYFKNSSAHAPMFAETRAGLLKAATTAGPPPLYESPVAGQLITEVSESQAQIGSAALVAALLIARILLGRGLKRDSEKD